MTGSAGFFVARGAASRGNQTHVIRSSGPRRSDQSESNGAGDDGRSRQRSPHDRDVHLAHRHRIDVPSDALVDGLPGLSHERPPRALGRGTPSPIVYAAACSARRRMSATTRAEPAQAHAGGCCRTLRDSRTPSLDGHPEPNGGLPVLRRRDRIAGPRPEHRRGSRGFERVSTNWFKIGGSTASSEMGNRARVRSPRRWTYIVDRQLTNVLPIFNCNGFGQADRVSAPAGAGEARRQARGVRVRRARDRRAQPAQILEAIDALHVSKMSGDDKAEADGDRRQDRQGMGRADAAGRRLARQAARRASFSRRHWRELDERRIELTTSLSIERRVRDQPAGRVTRPGRGPERARCRRFRGPMR